MTSMSAEGWVGSSAHSSELMSFVRKVANSSCNVLVTGETGTGKEIVAHDIHTLSARSKAPLVCFNCAAVPDSLFESELFGHEKGAFTGAWQRNEGRMAEAHRGTLFLDEIGELTLQAQAKVLRVLETRQIQRIGGKGQISIDIRIIAATNQNLESLVQENRFRKDLFFRLNVARVSIPPLRERTGDIMPLARHFLNMYGQNCCRPPVDFAQATQDALLRYHWPGNVRELKNAVEVAVIHDPYPLVDLEHLPEPIRNAASSVDRDREQILRILRISKWNKSEAAKQLNWSRMTLYRKMARYSIEDEDSTSQAIANAG